MFPSFRGDRDAKRTRTSSGNRACAVSEVNAAVDATISDHHHHHGHHGQHHYDEMRPVDENQVWPPLE